MAQAKKTGGTDKAEAAEAGGMTDKVREAGEKMRASGERIAERGSELGMKLLDQAEQNTREAFAAMRKAAQSRDVSEVMRVQGDYLREQGSRSMAHAREVGEMIANFGRDAINRMTGRDETK